MNDRTKKAFDFAQQSVTQLITLASATIALEVTLLKDLVEDRSGWTGWFAEASWILFLVSIVLGSMALAEMAGTLDPLRPKNPVTDQQLSIYRPKVLRIFAGLQFVFFALGLLSTIALGFNTIGSRKNEKEPAPAPTATPTASSTPTSSPTPTPGPKPILLRSLHFDSDRSTLRLDDAAMLDEVIDTLGLVGKVSIRVNGYCDATGREEYNLRLSQERAQSVASYLAAHGISKERVIPQGFGQTHYLATNATAEGRAQNRRVELLK